VLREKLPWSVCRKLLDYEACNAMLWYELTSISAAAELSLIPEGRVEDGEMRGLTSILNL
jgi:hypothetical protein